MTQTTAAPRIRLPGPAHNARKQWDLASIDHTTRSTGSAQHGTSLAAHPYRVLVPVLPLELVVEQTAAIEQSLGLLRSRDAITPYMYLPPLPGILESEHVACLFRPTLVSDDLLRDPPRRVAQLQPLARRQLKVKLAAYWGRAAVNPEDLPLHERDEDELAAGDWPASPYDRAAQK